VAESELFGHVRGAFTGADQTHAGLLERAHGGTIFFDEVADIPPSIQVKLLRVLEYGEVLPVGGARPIQCDFRVISATHQSLYQRVCEGAFRHDLYFRLVTFEIEIPPLRERRQDIASLTDHFLAALSAKSLCPRPDVPSETRAVLESRDWWGNVRELRNALEHAMILARGGPILPDHLPSSVPARDAEGTWDGMLAAMVHKWTENQLQRSPDAADLREQLLKVIEPPLFEVMLHRHHGQFASAARQLGLHRVTLKKKMDEYRRRE
jgi:two-component system nitrogen regulation response regulator GlnG